MKFIGLILGLCFLASCVTARRCLEKFPPVVSIDTVWQTTVRDTMIYRDTTITITLPAEIIRDTLLIEIKPKEISRDTLRVETEYAEAIAFFKSPSIHLELIQKDIFFKAKLDSVIRLENHWRDSVITIQHNTASVVKSVPTIYKVALWMWVGALIFIIFALILKRFSP
jgi:low affinity Fe/Cu permease